MQNRKTINQKVYNLVFTALMAAIVFVASLIRFQLLESKIHLGNTMCVFAGFILSPVYAGVACGLGSIISDVVTGYAVLDIVITFVSKFAIGFVSAVLLKLLKRRKGEIKGEHTPLINLIAACASLTYVVLYMLKSFIKGGIAAGSAAGGIAVALEKLPASLINAAAATVIAPVLYWSIVPALTKAGLLEHINPDLK